MCKKMVPEAGVEPARYCYRGILSPLRLPVPPLGQVGADYRDKNFKCKFFFRQGAELNRQPTDP